MQISSILSLALLPLLAVADGATSTETSTTILYKTITIQRAVSTATAFNTTSSSYMATGTGLTRVTATPTTSLGSSSAVSPIASATSTENAGGILGAANVAAAGLVGVVVAALM